MKAQTSARREYSQLLLRPHVPNMAVVRCAGPVMFQSARWRSPWCWEQLSGMLSDVGSIDLVLMRMSCWPEDKTGPWIPPRSPVSSCVLSCTQKLLLIFPPCCDPATGNLIGGWTDTDGWSTFSFYIHLEPSEETRRQQGIRSGNS